MLIDRSSTGAAAAMPIDRPMMRVMPTSRPGALVGAATRAMRVRTMAPVTTMFMWSRPVAAVRGRAAAVAAAKAGSGRSPRLRQTVAVWDAATKAMTASQTESHPGPAKRTPAVTTAHATPSRPWGRVLWWTTARGATGLASGTGAGSGAASGAAAAACCPTGVGTGRAAGGGGNGSGTGAPTPTGPSTRRPTTTAAGPGRVCRQGRRCRTGRRAAGAAPTGGDGRAAPTVARPAGGVRNRAGGRHRGGRRPGRGVAGAWSAERRGRGAGPAAEAAAAGSAAPVRRAGCRRARGRTGGGRSGGGGRCGPRASAGLDPPETGGRTATMSWPVMTVPISAGWPFTHTRDVSSTRPKRSPNWPRALSSSSATVVASISARAVPAASRADANRRRVGTAALPQLGPAVADHTLAPAGGLEAERRPPVAGRSGRRW